MGTMRTPSVSVVVPVYNSETTLRLLVARVSDALSAYGSCFEIVLVNDGSCDRSWDEIVAIATEDHHVRGVDLMRNFGQHNAVLAGVRAATGEVVVTIDDDLQHPPECIPELLAALNGDDPCDLVYGTPMRLSHNGWRNISTVAAKVFVERVAAWPGAKGVTDFRAFRTNLRDGFATYSAPAVVFDALLAWTTTSIKYVPVEHARRAVGRSNYRLATLLDYAAATVTVFSTRPLRLIAGLGALCFVGGLAGVVGVLIDDWVAGGAVLTVGLVLAMMFVLASVQLLSIGVLGEYVGRAQLRLLDKSPYLVRRTTADAPSE